MFMHIASFLDVALDVLRDGCPPTQTRFVVKHQKCASTRLPSIQYFIGAV